MWNMFLSFPNSKFTFYIFLYLLLNLLLEVLDSEPFLKSYCGFRTKYLLPFFTIKVVVSIFKNKTLSGSPLSFLFDVYKRL